MRARRDDGAQDSAIVVPLLEAERDRERGERGQRRERSAHAHLRALAQRQRIRHAQRLERRARGEHLRLHERAAERADLGERVRGQVGEHARRGDDARRVALQVQLLQIAVRLEEGAE